MKFFIIALILFSMGAHANQYRICKPGLVHNEVIDSLCFDYTKVETHRPVGDNYLEIKLFNVKTTFLVKMTEAQLLEKTKP